MRGVLDGDYKDQVYWSGVQWNSNFNIIVELYIVTSWKSHLPNPSHSTNFSFPLPRLEVQENGILTVLIYKRYLRHPEILILKLLMTLIIKVNIRQ